MSRRFVAAWLTVIAIGLISLPADANVIAIDNPYPTGDAAGTWDAVFTHDELAEIRSAGGLTLAHRGLIAARLAPAPAPLGTLRPVSPGVGATSSSAEEWRWLVELHFAPGDVDKGLRVIWCESRGDPSAKNPSSTASGLWQHLATYWESRSAAAGISGASIWDPEASTIVAAWLVYSNGGWGHWPNCGKL